ncbi:MAG TPA: glycosyltransferase, partial [Candidatus Krumholzibacteria bacterium]|nr:glycosyltransferase [Candidatus Krumholzibacteria bacterium]
MNINAPTVSVVIPTYNRQHLVDRAIQSVCRQTLS